MKRFFFVTSATAVAILAACSSPTTTSSDACSKYFDTVVQVSARCGTTNSSYDATNKSNFLALCQATLAAPGSGVSASYLDNCSSAAAASSNCNTSQIPACANPPGTLADGAACYSGTQCKSGACAKTGSAPVDGGTSTGLSCGTCEARAAENAPCDSSGAPALRCMSSLTCTNGVCVKPTAPATIPSGGACSFSGPPGTNCITGTTCIPGSGGAGTCTPIPKKGEKCTFLCDTNLVCTAGTCQDRVAAGGACPTGNECQTTLTCDQATKVCVVPKTAKAGETCGGTTNVRCDTGLNCVSGGTTSTCVAPKNKGEACSGGQSNQCAVFLECISGTCQTADPSLCK